MDKKNISFLHVIVPFFIGIFLLICFIIGGLLENITNRSIIYSFLVSVSMMSFFILPIPSLVSSIIGMKKSEKLKKDIKILVNIIGSINIIVSVLIIFLILFVIFVTGPSV